MKQWLPPRKIELSNTSYPGYICHWAGDGLVVSERFMLEYEKVGLSGIAAFNPVEVVKVHGYYPNNLFPKYYDAIPILSVSSVDYQHSNIKVIVTSISVACAIHMALHCLKSTESHLIPQTELEKIFSGYTN